MYIENVLFAIFVMCNVPLFPFKISIEEDTDACPGREIFLAGDKSNKS